MNQICCQLAGREGLIILRLDGGLGLCKLPGFARLDSPFGFAQGRLGGLSLHGVSSESSA